jgi:TnpA family transposase
VLIELNTIYPTVNSNIDAEQIKKIFTPSEDEILFTYNNTSNKKYQILLLVLLKSYQKYRRFIQLLDLPFDVIAYVANIINFQEIKSGIRILEYDRSRQRLRHAELIRRHLNIKEYSENKTLKVAFEFSKIRENIESAFNCTVEEMIFINMEFPAFSTLKIIVDKAMAKANNYFYKQIYSCIPSDQKDLIDRILLVNSENYSKQSNWKDIKSEPPAVSANNLKAYTKHVQWLQSLSVKRDILDSIPMEKVKQFYSEGMSHNLYMIKRLPRNKQYSLIVVVLQKTTQLAVDNLIGMIMKTYASMKSSARNKLIAYKTGKLSVVDELVSNFESVLECYSYNYTKSKRIDAIDSIVAEQHEDLHAKCCEYNAYKIDDPYPILLAMYKLKRSMFWNTLSSVKILSCSKDKAIQDAIDFICKNFENSKETIQLSKSVNWKELSLDWIPDKAKKFVKPKNGYLNRNAYELCLISKMVDEIRSKDLYVLNSLEYDTHKQNLISTQRFEFVSENYCKLVGIPRGEQEFVNFIESKLEEKTKITDNAFNSDAAGAKIEKGKLILKKVTASPKPSNFDELDQIITSKMPNVGILDVISSVTESLQLKRYLRPISGNDSKQEDIDALLASTIFCYGCNVGVNEASRSLHDINRKQLARINSYYVTEDSLKRCITEVVNCYNRYQLPKFWGTGEHVSVDGTKWDMYRKNLLSEYHIRYGGFGGIGYYHISDTYIALFSNLISCGSYEALHIIGDILSNRSDIKPTCVHGDTHSQSYPIFAVAYLLGIKIMPRIRGIKDLIFYKANKNTKTENIDEILGQKINWKLIKTHYNDMLRIVISIKECRTDIKSMMSKICTKSKKNKIYYAFRELGRAIRTCYLLEYITDYDLRKFINAATCKSEEFNGFLDWVAFARDIIPSNSAVEQRKFIKYNHLVANMVILYNVNEMSKIIKGLNSDGINVDYELLRYFSPYKSQHISRLGFYEVGKYVKSGNIVTLEPNIDIFSKY